jgi:hypothetical protein
MDAINCIFDSLLFQLRIDLFKKAADDFILDISIYLSATIAFQRSYCKLAVAEQVFFIQIHLIVERRRYNGSLRHRYHGS